MEMAPPKRWARRSSVGALVHSPEQAADSLVLCEALTEASPQSEQRGLLSTVTSQGWMLVSMLASGTICAM
jgi:hypothetical protein